MGYSMLHTELHPQGFGGYSWDKQSCHYPFKDQVLMRADRLDAQRPNYCFFMPLESGMQNSER